MSEYNELYYNEKFKPTQKNDLDKSWTNMWANTDLTKNSNILDIMLGRETFVEGAVTSADVNTALTNQNTELKNVIQKL